MGRSCSGWNVGIGSWSDYSGVSLTLIGAWVVVLSWLRLACGGLAGYWYAVEGVMESAAW